MTPSQQASNWIRLPIAGLFVFFTLIAVGLCKGTIQGWIGTSEIAWIIALTILTFASGAIALNVIDRWATASTGALDSKSSVIQTEQGCPENWRSDQGAGLGGKLPLRFTLLESRLGLVKPLKVQKHLFYGALLILLLLGALGSVFRSDAEAKVVSAVCSTILFVIAGLSYIRRRHVLP